jgi:hypothetical protein
MASLKKRLDAILSGRSDANIRFQELRQIVLALGFRERPAKGSHHIFYREGVEEIINLQPLPGGKAKAYQVKQVRQIVTKYGLAPE